MTCHDYLIKQALLRAGMEKDAAGFLETLAKFPKGLMQLGKGMGAVGEAGAQLGKDVAGAAGGAVGGAVKGVLGGGQSATLQAMQEAQKARLLAKAKGAGQAIRANIPPPGM